jgi:multimeric flavodoxin WrbA
MNKIDNTILEIAKSKTQECNNTILEISKSKIQECNNWFNTHHNKKKIEQTLKNLEGNLTNEQ